jgi:hypothetical protein
MSTAIIGLVGVIVGSILASFKDLVAHFFKRRSNGRYAAVRIIVALDEYTQKCVSVVADDGTCEGRPAGTTEEGEEYYDPQVVCPEPPIFPDDVDWRSISFKLMYRILSLPITARDTNRYIGACAEHPSRPDYYELFAARQKGYTRLGLEAANLVTELRKEFGLPQESVDFWNWDSVKFFQDKLNEFKTRHQNNTIANAMMIDESTVSEGRNE